MMSNAIGLIFLVCTLRVMCIVGLALGVSSGSIVNKRVILLLHCMAQCRVAGPGSCPRDEPLHNDSYSCSWTASYLQLYRIYYYMMVVLELKYEERTKLPGETKAANTQ